MWGQSRPEFRRPLDQLSTPIVKTISPKANDGSGGGAIGGSGSFKGARVKGSGTQSLVTATDTVLTFDTEDYDIGDFHSTVSNTSRLTVPAGMSGYYRIFGNIYYAANVTGSRWATIIINGTATILVEQSQMTVTTAAYQTLVCVAADVHLVAGDYIELRGHQTSGGNLNVDKTRSFIGISLIALD